jgi:hypothetical protein
VVLADVFERVAAGVAPYRVPRGVVCVGPLTLLRMCAHAVVLVVVGSF